MAENYSELLIIPQRWSFKTAKQRIIIIVNAALNIILIDWTRRRLSMVRRLRGSPNHKNRFLDRFSFNGFWLSINYRVQNWNNLEVMSHWLLSQKNLQRNDQKCHKHIRKFLITNRWNCNSYKQPVFLQVITSCTSCCASSLFHNRMHTSSKFPKYSIVTLLQFFTNLHLNH